MDLEATISNLEKMYEDAQKFILDTTVRKLAEILKECKKYSHIIVAQLSRQKSEIFIMN